MYMPNISTLSSSGSLELLRIINQEHPPNVSQLAARTGRAQSNVSRSLQLLARHGLIRLERAGKEVRPVALARSIGVDLAAGTWTPVGDLRSAGAIGGARRTGGVGEEQLADAAGETRQADTVGKTRRTDAVGETQQADAVGETRQRGKRRQARASDATAEH